MSPPVTRKLARWLLIYEAAAGKGSEPTESAASRVCEKLRQPLCSITGVAGFRSILLRALVLARSKAPSLGAVQVAPDGSLKGLDELGRQKEKVKNQAVEAGAILIAQLLDLLLLFIGEGITLRLVQEVWPEAALNARDSGKEKKT